MLLQSLVALMRCELHAAIRVVGEARCGTAGITSVNVVEFADGLRVATAQAGLGDSCRDSLVGAGLSISAMASTPM